MTCLVHLNLWFFLDFMRFFLCSLLRFSISVFNNWKDEWSDHFSRSDPKTLAEKLVWCEVVVLNECSSGD